MKRKQGLLLLSVGITGAVMALIIWFSGQPVTDSDSLSRGLAQKLLELCSVEPTAEQLSYLNHILRKLAHFTLYFVLGCGLTSIALHKPQHVAAAIKIAILLGFVFAASDEFHQFFSDGRGPSVKDVLLDTCGVAAGSLCFTFCRHRMFRKKRR